MGRSGPISTTQTTSYRTSQPTTSPNIWQRFVSLFLLPAKLSSAFFASWQVFFFALQVLVKAAIKILTTKKGALLQSPLTPFRVILSVHAAQHRAKLGWWWWLSAVRLKWRRFRITVAAWWLQTPWLLPVRWFSAFLNRLFYPFYALFRYYPLSTLSALTLSVLIFAGAFWMYDTIFLNLPNADNLMSYQPTLSTKILDRNGNLLYSLYKDENRTLVPLNELPPYVMHATIAIEDKHFYSHPGFDIEGITRAFFANLQKDTVQGGSTITQQLIKNIFFSFEKNWQRKVKEILVAIMVERRYTKDQILEMYLNQVAYGGSTYGIEEAAQRFFNKSARHLSLAEATLLAGLPQAPSVYSPFGANPEYAAARQQEVLRRMVEDGYISSEQAALAKTEKLVFNEDSQEILAPHFVMYVRSLLAQKYGETILTHNGLEVTTTLDLPLQEKTQSTVSSEITSLERLRISNGAALVTNPQTGEILSMVGSKNYFDFAHDGQVNVTLRARQPGSSIKPLTYALALERGMTPASTIADEPVVYTAAGSEPYSPKNYDGKFHGTVTLREALASSYNIPAVKLLHQIGLNTLIDKAKAIGVSTWEDRKRFGLALTLGAGEVPMVELAQIYGTFANDGYTVPLNPILEIKDAAGNVLYENTCALQGVGCQATRNFSPLVAAQISSILSDNFARTPAFGPQSVLHIPGQEVAVKTGTTNNMKDNWTIGYTGDRLVAVWVGNNDNTPMSYVASGITGASPIWNKIMRSMLSTDDPHHFALPSGLIQLTICTTTGKPSCGNCGPTKKELFIAGTEPKVDCSQATPQSETAVGTQPVAQR